MVVLHRSPSEVEDLHSPSQARMVVQNLLSTQADASSSRTAALIVTGVARIAAPASGSTPDVSDSAPAQVGRDRVCNCHLCIREACFDVTGAPLFCLPLYPSPFSSRVFLLFLVRIVVFPVPLFRQ